MRKFRFAWGVWTAALLLGGAGVAQAESWPAQPIRIVVPFAAGGGVDNVARSLAAQLSTQLGQTVIVENRTGAGGLIGTSYVANASPDGYTLLLGTQTTLAVAPLMNPNSGLDPLKALTGVSQVASSPLLLVANPAFEAQTLPDLLAYAKRNPGQLNYGSGGVGTTPHMAAALLGLMAGVKMTHVPYKGEQPALTDVVGNQIPVMFSNLSAAMPFAKSGKLKALAISTAQRSPELPDVPTVAEAGVAGFEAATWFGVVGPKGMPKDRIERLDKEIEKAMQTPELVERLQGQGLTVAYGDSGQFNAYIASEYDKWKRVIEEAGIAAQ